MEKMRLELDKLQVTGFATAEAPAISAGTVRAHEATAACNGTTTCTATNCTSDCTDITSCGMPCP
jgi:hypothetical protein